jgi:hypothetical protein
MNFSRLPSLITFVFLAGFTGCAPTDNVVGEHSSTSTGTGTGVESTGTATGVESTGTATGVESTGTTTGVESTGTATGIETSNCDDYDDATSSRAIEIVVKNERSTPIFIGPNVTACFGDQAVSIYDDSSTKLELTPPRYNFDDEGRSINQTCQDYANFSTVPQIAVDCAPISLKAIAANSSSSIYWNGFYLISRKLRSACAKASESGPNCEQIIAAAKGRYRATVRTSTSFVCREELGDCSSCTATNGCSDQYVGMAPAGELLEASVEFDTTNTSSITVTFTD